ncbi:SAM-dependent methyltransferase [Streptomyces sp. NPDC020707]|uniref:SAM-dependent methyltransferase n=1 Tax=Streptomyces sp. NPDC020707 TaxID=3365084 RepID=UPI0037BC693B
MSARHETRANPLLGLPTAASFRGMPLQSSSARLTDCLLGGKDNYLVDSKLAESLEKITGGLVLQTAREQRRFTVDTLMFLARRGIRQFVDIGCGLPSSTAPVGLLPSAMNVAVVYVDRDPVPVAHAGALLMRRTHGPSGYALVDFVENDVLQHPHVASVLDFSRPIGVLMHDVLHEVSDADAHRAVSSLTAQLPPGSALSITHPTASEAHDLMHRMAGQCAQAGLPSVTFRDPNDLSQFLDGLDLLGPGVEDTAHWHNERAGSRDHPCVSYSAIGLKPLHGMAV